MSHKKRKKRLTVWINGVRKSLSRRDYDALKAGARGQGHGQPVSETYINDVFKTQEGLKVLNGKYIQKDCLFSAQKDVMRQDWWDIPEGIKYRRNRRRRKLRCRNYKKACLIH